MLNKIKSISVSAGTPFEAELVVLENFDGYVDFKDKRFNSSQGILPWFVGTMEDEDKAEARVRRHHSDLVSLMETALRLLSITA